MSERVDVLFINGRIWTGDRERPWAHSLAVRDGRIVALDAHALAMSAAHTIDLAGAFAMPGFHDAHVHLSGLGQALGHCELGATAAPDLASLYRRLHAFADSLPVDAWVIGEGWTEAALGATPDLASVDAATGGRPAWLIHASHHAGFVNTAAMRRLGFAGPRDVPDVPGGVVRRDAVGAATGYVAEAAAQLVRDTLRPEPFSAFVDAIGRGSDALLALGVTSATEPGFSGTITGNGPDDYAAFGQALTTGRLRVRTTVMPELAALHRGFRRDACTQHPHRLRIGAVKLFTDGAIGNRTASLHDPYCSPADAGRGIAAIEGAELTEIVTELHRTGWQVAAHALGDRAIEQVLDAYAEALRVAPRADHRHRIEHATLATHGQVRRMHELSVIPVPQARFLADFGDTYREALGEQRAAQAMPIRTMLEHGLVVPGSSDAPVASASPLLGIASMVQRRTSSGATLGPSQAVDVEAALTAYTRGSAYAEIAEADRGTITAGRLADLVVLSHDPMAFDPNRLDELRVLATIVGGTVEFGDLGA